MSFDENRDNDRAIQDAIRKLSSADDIVRANGRQELVKIGPRAAPAVVNLLSDLIRDRSPRFDEENREQGTKALSDYITQWVESEYTVDDSEAYRTVRRLAINDRLFSDAVSLLGELKALEGIPILLRIMERKQTSGAYGITAEMKALKRIGSPVVPILIETIQTARQRAILATYGPPVRSGIHISVVSDDDFDDWDEFSPDQDTVDAEDEPEIERRTYGIEQDAIQILAASGDKSALPFLESLVISEQGKTWGVDNAASRAIREIKGEPIISNSPRSTPINWD